MNQIFFLDTETTSSDTTKARVVQFSIVSDGYEWEWNTLPPVDIDIGAMATHHITPKHLSWALKFNDCIGKDILLSLIDGGWILVAHNAPYDVAVLHNEWITVPRYIDTLKVAKHILDDSNIESYGLQYLRYFYKLDDLHEWELRGGFAHSALYDTIVLKWFYEFLESKMKKLHPWQDPIERMLELTHTPILMKSFRFWKYNGKTFEEVASMDPQYLFWLKSSEMKKPENERNTDMIFTINNWISR